MGVPSLALSLPRGSKLEQRLIGGGPFPPCRPESTAVGRAARGKKGAQASAEVGCRLPVVYRGRTRRCRSCRPGDDPRLIGLVRGAKDAVRAVRERTTA